MKCQDFERVVNDLAAVRLLEAAAQAEARLHAESCARCAARLADELALSAGLRTLAQLDEQRAAPAAVEAALLRSFRQTAPGEAAGKVLPLAPARKWPRWTLAAAALLLAALALTVWRWLAPQTLERAPARQEQFAAATPSPQVAPAVEETLPPARRKPSRSTVKPLLAQQRRAGAQIQRPPVINEVMLVESEIATDFLPFTYTRGLPPLESGQVIRVQLPRSALVTFGLPMNVEQADVPVKADVLMGEDGLARAIRFVR